MDEPKAWLNISYLVPYWSLSYAWNSLPSK